MPETTPRPPPSDSGTEGVETDASDQSIALYENLKVRLEKVERELERLRSVEVMPNENHSSFSVCLVSGRATTSVEESYEK